MFFLLCYGLVSCSEHHSNSNPSKPLPKSRLVSLYLSIPDVEAWEGRYEQLRIKTCLSLLWNRAIISSDEYVKIKELLAGDLLP